MSYYSPISCFYLHNSTRKNSKITRHTLTGVLLHSLGAQWNLEITEMHTYISTTNGSCYALINISDAGEK